MKLATIAVVTLLVATAARSAEAPKLDMLAFFTGRTHAENELRIAFKRPTRLVVDSVGGKGDKGDFVLIDTIHEGDKPVRTRKWVMRPAGPNRYTGSLSDATGPVDVAVDGSSAIIRYTMKGGLKVTQRMDLLGDGKTLSNTVVVKKLGMRFAQVEGKIRKLD